MRNHARPRWQHRLRTSAVLVLLVAATVSTAVMPALALAQSGRPASVSSAEWRAASSASSPSSAGGAGSSDWTSIFGNATKTAKSIATFGFVIASMLGIAWAWAQQSFKSIGLTLIMLLLAGMAVSGKLWSTSQATGEKITGAGAGQQGP